MKNNKIYLEVKTEASSDDNIDKENENVVANAIEIKQEIDDEAHHKKTRRSSNMSSTNKSPKNCAKRKRGSVLQPKKNVFE